LAIYFDNEYHLEKALEHDAKKHDVATPRFTPGNSKQMRSLEADRSIRVHNIPLETKSDVIRYYFDKFGTITKFSMNTHREWQIAYITYESKDQIARFYDT
jgi:RNA recognition motif-containing protein